MNMSRLLGSNRTNEYSEQREQSKFIKLVPFLRYILGLTVCINQPSLCSIVHLLQSIIREVFVIQIDDDAVWLIFYQNLLNLHYFDKIYLHNFDIPAAF